MTPLASMVGSAWLGSPWLRSQAAHSSTSRVGPLAGCVAGLLPPLVPLPVPGSVLVPRLATCGVLDPLLQAASTRAPAATRTASAPRRRCILVISRRLPLPRGDAVGASQPA